VLGSIRTIGDSVIVGRARCADSTWILNEAHQLVEFSWAKSEQSVQTLRGLAPNERPWGLACLTDQSLWTLSSPRTLARLDRDGRIAERLTLPMPWTELFEAGDDLLFVQVPPVAGSPLLASAPPRRPQDVRPWLGLTTRVAATRVDLLTANLIHCGLTQGSAVPCWFPADTDVTLSDGQHVIRHSFASVRAPDVDRALPLRDVAYVERGRVWLLATSGHLYEGRRAGGRVLLATTTGPVLARLDIDPPARLILAATETSCVVLTVGGDLVELRAR
jgi:hypothetical protein